MTNPTRKEKKLLTTRVALVKAALDEGKFSRREICKATELKTWELNEVFAKDRELYALYKVRLKSIASMATDNIVEILNDPNHPQHFQASKLIYQDFKTEIDEVLEPKANELEIQVPTTTDRESTSPPVVIKFSTKKKIEE